MGRPLVLLDWLVGPQGTPGLLQTPATGCQFNSWGGEEGHREPAHTAESG